MMPINFNMALGVVVLAVIIGSNVLAYKSGYNLAKQAGLVEMAKQSAVFAKQAHDASKKYQQDKLTFDKQVRQQNETIQKIINENSIYRNHCIDDDGLRELRTTIKNANSP